MPVGIRILEERAQSTYTAPIHTVYGDCMYSALKNAVRWCVHHHLAARPEDHAPDKTLYLYDCLGGLRVEVRRRDREITLVKT